MGIPHLISTLEPYAQHTVLQDVDVVVDGPGLAHHILHVCRVNGVDQPSYQLLGKTAVTWLDILSSQNVTIKMIYFDGYLPIAKRPVRMERAVKSMAQLTGFYNTNSRGCPRHYIAESARAASIDPFVPGRPKNKPIEPPSFLVPAVIEALRRSQAYQSLVQIVPGEADGYCAKDVAKGGGIVITSDSDLLVHDLGDGGVALLRDIYRSDGAVVRAAVYYPRQIFQKLGLHDTSDICRFAYERSCSVHATTAMLIRACGEPVTDQQRYHVFCMQYRDEERAEAPVLSSAASLSLAGFDPRWLELVLQLSQPMAPEESGRVYKMFLSALIDSPEKGTAWENSRYIRQLAYSIARHVFPGSGGSIHEYRRVHSLDQSGRQVTILAPSSISSETEDLVEVLQRLDRILVGKRQALYWLLVYIILDIRGSVADGRASLALEMVRKNKWPKEITQTIPWTFMHFIAHLQAVYYSLRLLHQLVQATATDSRKIAGPYCAALITALDRLPLLEASPGVVNTLALLNAAQDGEILETLAHFVDIPKTQADSKTSSKRSRKQKANDTISKKPTKSTTGSNMFGLLSME